MFKMSFTEFTYSLSHFLKRGTALFCGKFSHVFSSATFNSETVFGFSLQVKLSKMLRASFPRYDICTELLVSCESHVDRSLAGIVQRHVLVLCAQSHTHLTESAAPFSSSRLQSSINFGNIN